MPRSARSRSSDLTSLPANGGVAAIDAASLARLIDAFDRLRTLLEQVLTPAPRELLTDYLTPAELAAAFRIKEAQLGIWKHEGFGPSRTRVRQLVLYRRKAVIAWLRSLEDDHQE